MGTWILLIVLPLGFHASNNGDHKNFDDDDSD